VRCQRGEGCRSPGGTGTFTTSSSRGEKSASQEFLLKKKEPRAYGSFAQNLISAERLGEPIGEVHVRSQNEEERE